MLVRLGPGAAGAPRGAAAVSRPADPTARLRARAGGRLLVRVDGERPAGGAGGFARRVGRPQPARLAPRRLTAPERRGARAPAAARAAAGDAAGRHRAAAALWPRG